LISIFGQNVFVPPNNNTNFVFSGWINNSVSTTLDAFMGKKRTERVGTPERFEREREGFDSSQGKIIVQF
jgi:hypothetical protein